MRDDPPDDDGSETSRYRGRIDGSIIARVGFGEKIFMSAFLGLALIVVGLLSFICVAVWSGNREYGELSASFKTYAEATNRRLDSIERRLERRDD